MTQAEVVEKVKTLGQEVMDRADDIVGDIDWMYDLKIILEVDVYGRPTLEARRYMCPRLRRETKK